MWQDICSSCFLMKKNIYIKVSIKIPVPLLDRNIYIICSPKFECFAAKNNTKIRNPSLSENTRGWTLNNWTLVTHNFWVFLSIIYYYIVLLAIPISSRWILILGNSLFIIPDFPNPSIHYFFLLFNPVIYYSLFIFSFHPRKFM